MANKTAPTDVDPRAFLAGVEPARRREDALALLPMFERVTGEPPVMWGPSIVGFGRYHYRYDSGREDDFIRTGFSPRKANMTVYLMPGCATYADMLARLGKHRHSVSCLYFNKLADLDAAVLEEVLAAAYADMARLYPA